MARQRSILGDNLRALRKMNGLSQDELARIAGVTRETENKWESGAIGNIRNSNIDAIRSHFGLSVDDLRSETCGLAAQLIEGEPRSRGTFVEFSRAPVWRDSSDPSGRATGLSDEQVEIPPSILRRHPNCFAFTITDELMSRVFPLGSVVVIDPDMQPSDAEGSGQSSVRYCLVRTGGGEAKIRRVVAGSTSAFVSTASYLHNEQDLMLPTEDLQILGTVIWYQSAQEL